MVYVLSCVILLLELPNNFGKSEMCSLIRTVRVVMGWSFPFKSPGRVLEGRKYERAKGMSRSAWLTVPGSVWVDRAKVFSRGGMELGIFQQAARQEMGSAGCAKAGSLTECL